MRESVRSLLAQGDATSAFVVAMTWGYGKVGYGPYRVARMLRSRADVGSILLESASLSPIDGYRLLTGRGRIGFLGPAFGTKWLHFAGDGSAAILDRLVGDWFAQHSSERLVTNRWSVSNYERYLRILHEWADPLSITAIEVEQVIFIDQATATRSQWADPKARRDHLLSPRL